MKYLFALVILVVLAGGAWFMLQPAPVQELPGPIETPEPQEPQEPQRPQAEVEWHNATENDIRVAQPLPGAAVNRSFTISGEARGGWFFEASFPMEILDAGGNTLLTGFIEAEGEWMTSEFVSFSTTTRIAGSYTGPATLVLHRDNASGLPEHDKSVSIPITIR